MTSAQTRDNRRRGTVCWLLFSGDHPMHAVQFSHISDAVGKFRRAELAMRRHGASISASIHIGPDREAATASRPVRVLRSKELL